MFRNGFKIQIFLIADLRWSAVHVLFSLLVQIGSATKAASVNRDEKRACGKSPTGLLSLDSLLEPELLQRGKYGCETVTHSSTKDSDIGEGWQG